MTRGEFLRLAASASTGWFTSGLLAGVPASSGGLSDFALAVREQNTPPIPAGQTPDDRAARISRAIADYDRQGIHRTATDTDNRSADWLLDQARQAGAAATLEPFALNRVDVQAAYVEGDGRRIEGLPFFDGTFTDERGVIGPLGAAEANVPLVLATLNANAISSEGQSLADLRRSDRVRAIVAVTQGAHAGLSPSNAAMFASPYGCPVLQVSSDDAGWLNEQSRLRRDVRVVARATRTPARASNVIATIAGSDPALPPVVVMTPRSGWWQCASERGGGLACWLEIARAVVGRTRRPMLLVASSGHELGHFGLNAFLNSRPALIKTAAAWLHLGANIGAAGGAARLQASDDQIEGIANSALDRANAQVQQHLPRGSVPAGEARNIHTGGGRYVSLLGTGPLFHSSSNRWPDAVDVAAVARFASAFSDIAGRI